MEEQEKPQKSQDQQRREAYLRRADRILADPTKTPEQHAAAKRAKNGLLNIQRIQSERAGNLNLTGKTPTPSSSPPNEAQRNEDSRDLAQIDKGAGIDFDALLSANKTSLPLAAAVAVLLVSIWRDKIGDGVAGAIMLSANWGYMIYAHSKIEATNMAPSEKRVAKNMKTDSAIFWTAIVAVSFCAYLLQFA